MTPGFAGDDAMNSSDMRTKLRGDLSQEGSFAVALTHRAHYFSRQLGVSIGLATSKALRAASRVMFISSLPPLGVHPCGIPISGSGTVARGHVGHVLDVVSRIEVSRVHARAIVARVKDVHARWYGAISQLIRASVGESGTGPGLFPPVKDAVTTFQPSTGPTPTAFRTVNVSLKAFSVISQSTNTSTRHYSVTV